VKPKRVEAEKQRGIKAKKQDKKQKQKLKQPGIKIRKKKTKQKGNTSSNPPTPLWR
jgi:hypothetical protein